MIKIFLLNLINVYFNGMQNCLWLCQLNLVFVDFVYNSMIMKYTKNILLYYFPHLLIDCNLILEVSSCFKYTKRFDRVPNYCGKLNTTQIDFERILGIG